MPQLDFVKSRNDGVVDCFVVAKATASQNERSEVSLVMTGIFALLAVVCITWDSMVKEPTPKPPPQGRGLNITATS